MKNKTVEQVLNRIDEVQDVIIMAYRENRLDVVDTCIAEIEDLQAQLEVAFFNETQPKGLLH